jgi:Sec7-like guanine-nucleotide exchange factor
MRYVVTIDSDVPFGAVSTATYVLDLNVVGFEYSETKTIEHLVKAVDDLRREVSKISNQLDRKKEVVQPSRRSRFLDAVRKSRPKR